MYPQGPSLTGLSRATGVEHAKSEVGMGPGVERGKARLEEAPRRRLMGRSRDGKCQFLKNVMGLILHAAYKCK